MREVSAPGFAIGFLFFEATWTRLAIRTSGRPTGLEPDENKMITSARRSSHPHLHQSSDSTTGRRAADKGKMELVMRLRPGDYHAIICISQVARLSSRRS